MKQYYDRLFIPEGSSKEDVKNAYHKLAKKFHPDINQNDDYIEEFKIIQEAYEYLIAESKDLPNDSFIKKPTFPSKKTIRDDFNYFEYSDEIEVENFVFKIIETKYSKTIGTNATNSVADGIYLIIKLNILNNDKQTRILSFTKFRLYDEDITCFESLGQEIHYLGIPRKETLFEKECQPKVPTFGYLIFEVPIAKQYYLELYGGKTDGCPSYIKKIIPLIYNEELEN
jgi:curved DNA-binding protein CbpA